MSHENLLSVMAKWPKVKNASLGVAATQLGFPRPASSKVLVLFLFDVLANSISLFLNSNYPTNILGYILIAFVWGIVEGFNYVVISKKINERYISKNKWLNYGAIVCGIACVLIHGMVGFDLYTIFEALTTFIIIYGMLIVKEKTNNAWGCIFIFLFFWNAI